MLIKCESLDQKLLQMDSRGMIKFLTDGGLLSSRGELTEPVEIFLGGPFFKGLQQKGEENRFPWVFSTFEEDRDEERIDPAGWDLKNYLKNPVVLWAHDHRIPAIGYADNTRVNGGILSGDVIFNEKETDPFGWAIGRRVAGKSIRAGSVGFLILKVEIQDNGSEQRIIFRNQELLEFSICNVPSNPGALHRSLPENRDFSFSLPPRGSGEEELKTFWRNLIRQD